MSNIKKRVAALIVDKLGIDESEITMNASFIQDLGADSLDTVELIMELEREFGIEIPDEVAEKLQTVRDVIQLVKKHKNEGQDEEGDDDDE